MLTMMWRRRNPLTLLVGRQTGAATLGNSMEVLQKVKTELPYNPAIALLGIYPDIHGSIINNSRTMERAQMTID